MANLATTGKLNYNSIQFAISGCGRETVYSRRFLQKAIPKTFSEKLHFSLLCLLLDSQINETHVNCHRSTDYREEKDGGDFVERVLNDPGAFDDLQSTPVRFVIDFFPVFIRSATYQKITAGYYYGSPAVIGL